MEIFYFLRQLVISIGGRRKVNEQSESAIYPVLLSDIWVKPIQDDGSGVDGIWKGRWEGSGSQMLASSRCLSFSFCAFKTGGLQYRGGPGKVCLCVCVCTGVLYRAYILFLFFLKHIFIGFIRVHNWTVPQIKAMAVYIKTKPHTSNASSMTPFLTNSKNRCYKTQKLSS